MSEEILTEDAVVITKEIVVPDGMNFSFLKKQGVDISQQLAGDIWTDFNEHDPGVTILEQMAFTLTELAFKANFEVEEIIFAGMGHKVQLKEFAFFPAQDIFPCNPLNIDDYRRLVIDHMYPLVENAWIVPLDSSDYGINMSGLYALYIQVHKGEEGREEEVVEQVRKLIHRHRNLCEDFHEIKLLRPLQLSLQTQVAVSPEIVVDTMIGKILHQLSNAVNPRVRFNSNEDLEEKGWGLDDIYNGTEPQTGYIFSEDLESSRFEKFMSLPSSAQLINVIRSFDGVEEVKQFEVGIFLDKNTLPQGFHLVQISFDDEVQGNYITSDVEDLPNGHKVVENLKEMPVGIYKFKDNEVIPSSFYPSLDIETILEKGLLSFTIDNLEYEFDQEIVKKSQAILNAEEEQQYQKMVDHPHFEPNVTKSRSDIESYYSVQNTFPEIYGITHRGLPRRVPDERKVQALQLKGYLFFFEQIMANYLSQLTNFNKLFALESDVEQTYFYQVPIIPEVEKVLGGDANRRTFQSTLDDLGQEFDPVIDRKNRALDHLLARFGEEFLSDAYNQLNQKATSFDQEQFGLKLIEAKIRFLKNLVELTRHRGKGYDYTEGPDSEELEWNVAVLKKRISLLFNISDHGHYSMSGVVKEDKDIQLANQGKKKKGGKGKKEEEQDDRLAFTFSVKDKEVLNEVLFHGLSRENFTVSPAQGKPGVYETYFHRAGEQQSGRGTPVFLGKSREDCERSISKLIAKLREVNELSEGFHIIENILLRPVGPAMFRAFLTRQGKKLMETGMQPKEGAVESFRKALLQFGTQEKNYKVEGDDESGYRIVLYNKEGVKVASKGGFVYKDSAAAELKETAGIIKDLRAGKTKVDIRLEEIIPRGALLADDFYSHGMAVVLPSWPARFRNDKFRMLFEQVIKQNAPAHLTVKCFWVDIEEMTVFEKAYQLWLIEKAKDAPEQPKLDQLSYAIIVMLKYFENPYDDRITAEMTQLAITLEDL